MLFDSINNLDRYLGLNDRFKKLEIFLNNFDDKNIPSGKFEIEDDSFFGIGLQYETKESESCLWEAHRKYIDIHIIIKGEEKIFVNDIQNMNVTKVYDKENDYELFEGEKRHELILKKGDFLILYPNEVHKTAIFTTAKSVKKVVCKLLY